MLAEGLLESLGLLVCVLQMFRKSLASASAGSEWVQRPKTQSAFQDDRPCGNLNFNTCMLDSLCKRNPGSAAPRAMVRFFQLFLFHEGPSPINRLSLEVDEGVFDLNCAPLCLSRTLCFTSESTSLVNSFKPGNAQNERSTLWEVHGLLYSPELTEAFKSVSKRMEKHSESACEVRVSFMQ